MQITPSIVSVIRQLINLEFQVILLAIHPDNFAVICLMLM